MGPPDKLIALIRARPPQAGFADVRRLLEGFGWHLDRQRGSHVTFVKPRQYPISFPLVSGHNVKRVYLDGICRRLGLDD